MVFIDSQFANLETILVPVSLFHFTEEFAASLPDARVSKDCVAVLRHKHHVVGAVAETRAIAK